jgi:hypothetical protein
MNPSVGKIGGTEARALVTMARKLYANAAIGYWKDTETGNPELPGGQVLRLDAPGAEWNVDLELDDRVALGPNAGQRNTMPYLCSPPSRLRRMARAVLWPDRPRCFWRAVFERSPGLVLFSREEGSSQ